MFKAIKHNFHKQNKFTSMQISTSKLNVFITFFNFISTKMNNINENFNH
jgi:hypothetical protein